VVYDRIASPVTSRFLGLFSYVFMAEWLCDLVFIVGFGVKYRYYYPLVVNRYGIFL
jgi:hypothetical protein